MTVNRENMEKWCQALETYEGETAKGMLINETGRMCAIGIGINAQRGGRLSRMEVRPNLVNDFREWLGLPELPNNYYHIPLVDGDQEFSITYVNDQVGMSPWEIAQLLRSTYLKDES